MKSGRKSEGADEEVASMSTSPTKKQRRRLVVPRSLNWGESSREKNAAASKSTSVARSGWPENQIPIEIFDEIISYLPRSSVKCMRLVNKEFEKKVSATFFQVVVVPFKPEIYGIAPEPALSGSWTNRDEELPQGSIMLQDKGMRVFHGFGAQIKKFAMSFEFEEEKLARPPTKDDQQAITTFWGIYPWPYTKYHRYAHLEGLEQTADETKTMARAFRHIVRATELGLSMDGGLGFLSGPDVNSRVFDRAHKPSVFGQPKYVPEPVLNPNSVGRHTVPLPTVLSVYERRYQECERMCIAAGYKGKELGPAVHLLLQNDYIPPAVTETSNSNRLSHENLVARPARPNDQTVAIVSDPDDEYNADDDDDAVNTMTPTRRSQQRLRQKASSRLDVLSLKPSDLTSAQREMLLEIEWAQRAFIQSYTIAVIDNTAAFSNIQTLNVARLPYRHLQMIRRDDFWDALPNVEKLSLAIIPDWRDVVKEPTGVVQDVKVAPSSAVAGVYQLLREQVSRRKNITILHFEWISGGEYAPGMFSRNQHVLPAPIISTASNMVNRKQVHSVLELPNLRHLSLKNCWSSPHILRHFLTGLQLAGLQTATFDSVSLTTSIPQGIQPGPQQPHQPHQVIVAANNGPNAIAAAPVGAQPLQPLQAQQAQFWNAAPAAINPPVVQQQINANAALQALAAIPAAQLVQAAPPPPPPPPAPVVLTSAAGNPLPDWLQPPKYDSWTSIINDITPGQTIEHKRWTLDLAEEPEPRPSSSLKTLKFTSCGYITLPLDFDQHLLTNTIGPALPQLVAKRLSDLDASMMKASDIMLGRIANFMDQREINTMQNAFNFTIGWLTGDQSRAELVLDCETDGVMNAGQGRFDGHIEIGNNHTS